MVKRRVDEPRPFLAGARAFLAQSRGGAEGGLLKGFVLFLQSGVEAFCMADAAVRIVPVHAVRKPREKSSWNVQGELRIWKSVMVHIQCVVRDWSLPGMHDDTGWLLLGMT